MNIFDVIKTKLDFIKFLGFNRKNTSLKVIFFILVLIFLPVIILILLISVLKGSKSSKDNTPPDDTYPLF